MGNLDGVLESIISIADKENHERAETCLSNLKRRIESSIESSDIEGLSFLVTEPYFYTVEAALTQSGLSDDAAFLAINYQYVENNFNKMYSQYEGSACCSDKSHYVVRKLFDFLRNKTVIEFDSNQKYTYHHPKKILNDHDSITDFFEGLKLLFYGNPQSYLDCIMQINKKLYS